MTAQELTARCLKLAGASSDCPFDEDDMIVLRHRDSRRWFGLIVPLPRGLCINLKCEPQKAEFWRSVRQGVMPAWHMNKTHWNSVFVNEDVTEEELDEMIADSYFLTVKKGRAPAASRSDSGKSKKKP